MIMWRCFCII